MAKKMIFSYDKEGDVLDISLGKVKMAISKEISEDFFIRVDRSTQKIVGFMMLNFEKRFKNKSEEKIPLQAEFSLEKGSFSI